VSAKGSDPRPPAGGNPFRALRETLGPSLPPGTKPAESIPPRKRPGPRADERITVRRERAGRGGKTVTVAEGPGLAGAKLEALAREAARAHGVGARVEDGALVLQGDQAERLVAWLAERGFGAVGRGN